MSMFLGDGSFEDCVQLGVFAEECDGNLDVMSYKDGFFEALGDVRVPAVVVDYVGSVIPVFDVRFSLSCSVSDAVVVEHLKRNYRGVEITSRSMLHEFSKCFSNLRERLYYYTLFEKSGAELGAAYRNHGVRMALSRDNAERFKILEELANSVDPVDCVLKNFDVEYGAEEFESVFFNKHLSVDDVFRLWDLMTVESGGRFVGFHHVYLLQAVLLREDWTADDLRLFFEWWVDFSTMLSERVGTTSWRDSFEAWCKSMNMLFASNSAMPADLLAKLFARGGVSGAGSVKAVESVRVAVMRNAAVGEDFVSDVVHGGGEVVVSGTSVVVSEVVRASALLNPVWRFEKLLGVFENEGESAGVRFGALFNENAPSFYRALYA